ncbi:MAG: TIGR03663 family protein, partial [Acidobacteriota bacterium]|nr:TIGR03663 family protein [Acidobacteriota bacterium]
MTEDNTQDLAESRTENIVCIAIFVIAVVIAAWLRFDQIGLKPFHHDEGVNSYFLLNLAHSGNYKYDPTNYHGPTLYYFALVAVRIFGETDFALRLSPALFGLLTVAMVWFLRRHLGKIGTLVAAFCLALSPCLVYYSRDFIHEMSFGCFSLGVVAGAWRYAESKKFKWLALAAISAGLLFTTKETAIVNAIVLLIAIICAAVWDAARTLIGQRQFSPAALVRSLRRDTAVILPSLDHLFAAIIIFVFIVVFFYSSVFTNAKG